MFADYNNKMTSLHLILHKTPTLALYKLFLVCKSPSKNNINKTKQII